MIKEKKISFKIFTTIIHQNKNKITWPTRHWTNIMIIIIIIMTYKELHFAHVYSNKKNMENCLIF